MGLKDELDRRFAPIEAQTLERRAEVGPEVHGKGLQETLSDGLSTLMSVVTIPLVTSR